MSDESALPEAVVTSDQTSRALRSQCRGHMNTPNYEANKAYCQICQTLWMAADLVGALQTGVLPLDSEGESTVLRDTLIGALSKQVSQGMDSMNELADALGEEFSFAHLTEIDKARIRGWGALERHLQAEVTQGNQEEPRS